MYVQLLHSKIYFVFREKKFIYFIHRNFSEEKCNAEKFRISHIFYILYFLTNSKFFYFY